MGRPRCLKISIHAPRGGSDFFRYGWLRLFVISIHAPRGGSDLNTHFFALDEWHISIHAPRGGSDRLNLSLQSQTTNFNPRSPRGERRSSSTRCLISRHFNPRSPRGERRVFALHLRRETRNFNPRSPRGERPKAVDDYARKIEISIHAPRGGSDRSKLFKFHVIFISIHAPRGGSDCEVLWMVARAHPYINIIQQFNAVLLIEP